MNYILSEEIKNVSNEYEDDDEPEIGVEPGDDEDGDNIHMIFVEKDENSIQELISDIDHPEIQSCKDIYLDIADDLQKFPKLNEVVTLREDDALVTCYGDFMNYFYPKSDQSWQVLLLVVLMLYSKYSKCSWLDNLSLCQ